MINCHFSVGNVDYNESDFDNPRSSKDIVRGNNFGKHLVILCGVFDIHFLNGRFSEDRCGELTCFSNNGVVDYMIASSVLFKYITDVKVLSSGDSDHYPIACSFKFPLKIISLVSQGMKPCHSVKSFRWRDASGYAFLYTLKQLLQTNCNVLQSVFETGVDTLVQLIASIYQEAGQCMLRKFRYLSTQPPWWDGKCD